MIYLYLKTHNVTGMKYLGKTTSHAPDKYTGSGKYWKRHLNVYGNDVTTQILFESDNPEKITEMGIYYSNLFDVVNSDEFANLKAEEGDGGWSHLTEEQIQKRYEHVRKYGGTFKGKTHSEESKQKIKSARAVQQIPPRPIETRRKISESLMGHTVSDSTRKKISTANKGNPSSLRGTCLSKEHRQKLSDSQKKRFETSEAPFKGKTHSEESKRKIKEARAKQKNVRKVGDYTPTEETKLKISKAHTGKLLTESTRKKISESCKGREQQNAICPFCGKSGGKPAMARWHFDNCKEKK